MPRLPNYNLAFDMMVRVNERLNDVRRRMLNAQKETEKLLAEQAHLNGALAQHALRAKQNLAPAPSEAITHTEISRKQNVRQETIKMVREIGHPCTAHELSAHAKISLNIARARLITLARLGFLERAGVGQYQVAKDTV